jgi:phosphoglycerate dehydrogenase-like enzyme
MALEPIDSLLFSAVPTLKVISKYGVGLDNIDFSAAKLNNVTILASRGVNSDGVRDLTIGKIISALRNITVHDRELKEGIWNPKMGRNVSECRVGVVGLGSIGLKVAVALRSFGAEVFFNDIDYGVIERASGEFGFLSYEKILSTCDIITYHVPLDKSTKGMLNSGNIGKLRPNAVIVNTCRGGVVDECSIIERIKNRADIVYSTDVYEREPYLNEFPSSVFANLIMTPHIGGTTSRSAAQMGSSAIRNLADFYARQS